MTKFFQDKQPRMVWNPAENKVAVTFQNGEFETDDPALVNLLVKAGYRHNSAFPEPEHIPAPVTVEVPKKAKPKMVRKKK